MSYILDALKKADAERERGTVPGLHSQHMGQEDDDDDDDGEAPARKLSPLVWIGAGVGLCVIALLSWKLMTRETPPEVMSPPQPAPDVATATVPSPPPDVAHNEPEKAPSMQSAVPPAQPARMTRDQVPPPVSPPMDRAMTQPHNAPPPLAREARQVTVAPNTTGTAPAAPARIPTLSELPEDVRRDIPQLVIGGAMYSETPSSRMLIINSQVFHEGDQPYQGLVLEEIRLKSAVFKYRSYRYSINY